MGDKRRTPEYETPRIDEIGTLHDLTRASSTVDVTVKFAGPVLDAQNFASQVQVS